MATCTSADSVLEAAALIKTNGTKLDTFVNGTASQTVQLGTGSPTPCLRKFIADAQSVVATAANEAAETVLDDVADMKLNKADKWVPAEPGNLAKLSSDGNLRDAGRAIEDFTSLLNYASGAALNLVSANGANVQLYEDWYADEIDFIGEAGRDAAKAALNVRSLIGEFDESVAQHRLQQRLFSGTNPTSSSKPVLFVISGQSNAVGSGEYGAYDHAEDCGQFWSWRDGANALKLIVDPIGKNGSAGSQWPSFARRFFSLTGRKVILLSIASGGSAVTDGGSSSANTWADNGYGNLRAAAASIWNAFSAAVPASDYDLGAILWSQGETEAGRIYAGTVTVEDYIEGTVDVLEWTRTLIGDADCPVFNCEIGYINTAMTNSALKKCYEDIQQAQKTLFNSENGLYDICAMPPRYINAWNEFEYGVIHYSPIGYRIVGDAFARASAHYLSL